jgi:hypothetical protein
MILLIYPRQGQKLFVPLLSGCQRLSYYPAMACPMLVPDVMALALPFVPGAANNVVKARRQVEDAGDAVRAARWVDDVGPYKVYVDPNGRAVPQY